MGKKKEKKQTKFISNKKRKELEKIVSKKEKKETRKQLISSLSKIKVDEDELKKFVSISSVQTKGLKKFKHDEATNGMKKIRNKNANDIEMVVPIAKLVHGGLKRPATPPKIKYKNIKDPNIVGFYDTESDSDDESNKLSNTTNTTNVGASNSNPVKMEVDEYTLRDPAVYILLDRNESIQKSRLKLPILYREQEIIQEINANNIVIITGETGCGKTTQLPQFLYEAAYTERNKKLIGITEPRRVAAISMSKRVAEEMNLMNGEVSYLIRFEGNATDKTRIKFMTDGVLMKEIQSDFLLSKYSVIILDEAHERSVYTDILIGLLSRIVPLRAKRNDPLKLVIMSATLCVDNFIKNKHLFREKRPPVINVENRQFKVTIHFSRVTKCDYLNEAFKKVCQIHSKLPAGGILVFVTGQAEVKYLVRKLRNAFPSRQDKNFDNDTSCRNKKQSLPEIDLNQYALPGEEINDSDLEEVNDDNTIEAMIDDSDIEYEAMEEMNEISYGPLWVLPLYSMLSSQEQNKIFEPVPASSRLCVVSTNVAETSLTIPGIHYIVDTGKVKCKLYDKVTGASKYEIDWITKANAEQRAGRAGRQGPGHCYRLYSSAIFQNDFKDFPLSEIEQKPIDDIVLQLKMLHIDKVINFPFPTPPSIDQLQSAEEHLKIMDIIDKKTGEVTLLGKKISEFPVSPRFGKMLIIGNQQGILEYVIIIVSALSVPELFDSIISESEICLKHRVITGEKESQGRKLGDIMLLLKMIGAAELAHSRGELEQFCKENNIRHKAVIEIRKMRYQITKVVNMSIPDVNLTMDPMLKPPNEVQTKLLRQLMLMGSIDKIARKIQINEVSKEDRIRLKYAYETLDLEEPVYMNTNCILIKELPEYVCYQELYETNKLFMRHVTQIESDWIPIYARNICSIFDPISNTEEYDAISGKIMCRVSGFFGKRNWPLPDILMEHPNDLSLYKHFGRFLLEGKVFQKLESFVCHLLSSPEILQRTWVKFHEKTEKLLKALLNKGAGSKENLQKIWQNEPMYLLNEYLMWLPETHHMKLKMIWPPLD